MLVIRGRRVVTPDGERPAAIHIENRTITRVSRYDDVDVEGAEVVDGGDLVIAPGLVDSHVHVNEPGRTEWEGFDSATRAAAAGGITTIVDMPLNSIPATVDVAALELKRQAARGRCHVNVGFWGGIVPGNEEHIGPLIGAGVRGFKCFLVPSGVPEFPMVTDQDLRRALPVLARTGGLMCPLLVHAEDLSTLKEASGDARAYSTFLATRPVAAEVAAVDRMAALAAEYRVRVHIVHVSSADGLASVARAQASGVAMTAETCPHYLTFSADEIADGATAFKCAPPIRQASHREALWHGLGRGLCDMVVTDHSPAPPALKSVATGDFVTAWGGIASLQLSLAAVWTGAAGRGHTVKDITQWMSRQPAILCGLSHRKGAIEVGYDADIVLWDPDASVQVEGTRLQHRHALTPYEGRTLRGAVRATYVGGVKVWDAGRLVNAGRGQLV
jgi:allantoinase